MTKRAHSVAATQERRTERMEMRILPSEKEFVRRAMAISGRSAADLAYEGAKQVLEEHERLVLTGRDRDAFLEAVRSPSPPAERLCAALQRHDELHQ